MKVNTANYYLLLVLVQAAHSIEEYFGHLWDVFPPAKWLTGLIASNRHDAFLAINFGLFIFGMFSWYFIVRKRQKFALVIVWFMVLLEISNGIMHIGWSIKQSNYAPGLITAPFLLIVAFLLAKTTYDDKVRSEVS